MADPYLYPDSKVLANSLGITDKNLLAERELQLACARIRMGVPTGDFGLEHLQAIHRHIFQDVYPWAGELRTVELNKGGHQFIPKDLIRTGMQDVHKRLVKQEYLKGLDKATFAQKAGEILGDVNHIHPFREGNGRTQMQYLDQLSMQAGHPLRLTAIAPKEWIKASREAHFGDYEPMAKIINRCAIDLKQAEKRNPKLTKGRSM